jgi:nucleoid-associated protein YgaU
VADADTAAAAVPVVAATAAPEVAAPAAPAAMAREAAAEAEQADAEEVASSCPAQRTVKTQHTGKRGVSDAKQISTLPS